MRYFDFSIAPGSVFNLSVRGDFFRYYSGSAGGADETIIVRGVDTGNVVLLKPGQSVRFDEPETRWELLNYAGAGTITGFVVVGSGEIRDDRITGQVSVINGEIDRVKAGKCFLSFASVSGVAGQYSITQLFNPVGSGKNLFVSKMWVAASTNTQSLMIRRTTLVMANWSESAYPKKTNGGLGVGQSRYENNVSTPGSNLLAVPSGFQQGQVISFAEPMMVEPGWGLLMVVMAVNVSATTGWEWIEENV